MYKISNYSKKKENELYHSVNKRMKEHFKERRKKREIIFNESNNKRKE